MTPVSLSTIQEALNWRYSTKKFDATKTIPADAWNTLAQSLILAPSSFGLQPWKFIVVQNPELRKKLSAASWGQTQPVECSHFVVFLGQKGLGASDTERYLQRSVAVRGGTVEALKGYADVINGSLEKAKAGGYLDNWQGRQVYIALGELMTTAALIGVDACPMEGLDPAQYDALLGIDTSKWGTLCACALGYRSSEDKYAHAAKVRYSAEELISYV